MGVYRPRPRLTYGVCTAANPTTGAAEARGRRTHNCAGMYTDEQVRGYRRVTLWTHRVLTAARARASPDTVHAFWRAF